MSKERDDRRAFPTDRELSRMALAEDCLLSDLFFLPTAEEAKKFKVLGAISGRIHNYPCGDETFETDNPHD